LFNSSLSEHLASDIAATVLPLGLSEQQLPQLMAALASGDPTAAASIPGVTPQIIGAGVRALQGAYLHAFRLVWVTAGVFSFVAAIGKLVSAPIKGLLTVRYSRLFHCQPGERLEHAC
jgi:hypothetical protein